MNKINRRPFVAVLFLAVLFMLSCEKPEDSIGLGLQQEEDLLSIVVDTLSFSAATVAGDSSRTSLSQAIVLLGEFNVPNAIGRAKSVFHTQLRPSALGVDFGEGFVCDSLILALEYTSTDSVYGDLTALLDFSVKRLGEDLSVDSVYYSTKEFLLYSDDNWMLPGAMQSDFNSYPTVVDGDTVSSRLRLHLDPTFGESVFYDESINGTALDNIDDFIDYFKGLRVEASFNGGEGGAIGSFDANASASRLVMYYHNDTDTAFINFSINTFTQRNLYFDLTPSTMLSDQFLDPSLGAQDLYVQAMTGANIEVTIDLDDIGEDTLAVNKAELIFKVDGSQAFDLYPAPLRIFGVYTNANGNTVSIPDVIEGELHSDGFFDETDLEYRVNVTSFLQRALTGEINTSTLRLLPVSNSGSADFVHLYGTESLGQEARLIVTYTKF